MKTTILVLLGMIVSVASVAQDKYYTKGGKIDFYSKAPLEDIEAKNKSVVCVLDTKSGAIQFSVLMKGFEFENDLMQEHFNEDYVESDKFPKSEFKGQIVNNAAVNYTKQGSYPVVVKGKLTMHGQTKEVEAPGVIKVEGGNIKATSTFSVLLSDFNIKIPSLVKDKVANKVKIVVDAKLDPLK